VLLPCYLLFSGRRPRSDQRLLPFHARRAASYSGQSVRLASSIAAVSPNLLLVPTARQVADSHSSPAKFSHHFCQTPKRAGCPIALRDFQQVQEHLATHPLQPVVVEAYGKSKLAAERGLAELDIDWVSLRLPLVYGRGVKGNMAKLMGVARSPLPLPFGSLRGRRSLLAVENLLAAVAPTTRNTHSVSSDICERSATRLGLRIQMAKKSRKRS
jgi:nucleoside-diphosphate-sugar epimerase